MGSESGGSWERPVHTVRTPAFEISARPVTNAEFRLFRPAHESPKNNANNAPVTGVSWEDAKAYCDWLSAGSGSKVILPPEAWWESAVRGGLDQKKYPWGDTPIPDGTEHANKFGVYAISYMLWEWTADWYKGTYYAESPQDNPGGPAEGVYRVLRGGGYRNDPASATVYARGSARPETRSERITFRVARAAGSAPAPTTITSAAPPPSPRPAPPTPVQTAAAKPPAPAPPAPAPRPATASTSSAASGSQSPGGPVDVSGVSFAEEGGTTMIKIATSGPTRFKAFALKAPDRLVVDVLDGTAVLRPVTGTLQVGKGGVKTVRYSQFKQDPPVFRAVIDLESAMTYRIEDWRGELRITLQH